VTERFLPDKAIDLVDEAAAKIKMEVDSMPAELDGVHAITDVTGFGLAGHALEMARGAGLRIDIASTIARPNGSPYEGSANRSNSWRKGRISFW